MKCKLSIPGGVGILLLMKGKLTIGKVKFSRLSRCKVEPAHIAKTISKHLGVVKRLKFKMNRQDLEKMYLVYNF